MELTIIEALILAAGSLGLGMILLIRGGNWTIDSAIYIARLIGVSPLVVGFTIIAFGTSLPELVVSILANLSGLPGISVGNVIGSNLANILFVIGAAATMTTIVVVPRTLLRDLVMMMLSAIAFAGLLFAGMLNVHVGLSMLAVLFAYTFWQYMMAREGEIPVEEIEHPQFKNMRNSLAFLVTGLACVALGAEFLVRGAKVMASAAGIPDDIIGLTVIAVGTSLPELSTCLIAAAKKQSDILLGNIIGSNVFNILMIIGATAAIKPINTGLLADQIFSMDIWLMLGVMTVFTGLLIFYRKINRVVGVTFLSVYAAYFGAIYLLNF